MATGLDDNFVTTDYRQLASYPVRSTGGYGGEDVPLISGQNGAPVTFTQIEHVPTQSIGNHQPSLIHIDGKDV